MPRSSSLRLSVALGTGLLFASTASAQTQTQTQTWDLSDRSGAGACTQSSGGIAGYGNVYSCAAQGTSATGMKVTATSALGTTTASGFQGATLTDQGSSGLGIGSLAEGGSGASSGNGDHAVDNSNNNGTDLMMFEFLSGPQVLRTVNFGWTSGDADFQVLRWAGAQMPGTFSTIGAALTGGWQLVTTMNGGNTGSYNVNAAGLASSYWAIGAYNPAFGNTAGTAVDGGDDKFKVKLVTTTSAPAAVVPEPSTYALFAAGLAGLAGAARRRRSA